VQLSGQIIPIVYFCFSCLNHFSLHCTIRRLTALGRVKWEDEGNIITRWGGSQKIERNQLSCARIETIQRWIKSSRWAQVKKLLDSIGVLFDKGLLSSSFFRHKQRQTNIRISSGKGAWEEKENHTEWVASSALAQSSPIGPTVSDHRVRIHLTAVLGQRVFRVELASGTKAMLSWSRRVDVMSAVAVSWTVIDQENERERKREGETEEKRKSCPVSRFLSPSRPTRSVLGVRRGRAKRQRKDWQRSPVVPRCPFSLPPRCATLGNLYLTYAAIMGRQKPCQTGVTLETSEASAPASPRERERERVSHSSFLPRLFLLSLANAPFFSPWPGDGPTRRKNTKNGGNIE